MGNRDYMAGLVLAAASVSIFVVHVIVVSDYGSSNDPILADEQKDSQVRGPSGRWTFFGCPSDRSSSDFGLMGNKSFTKLRLVQAESV